MKCSTLRDGLADWPGLGDLLEQRAAKHGQERREQRRGQRRGVLRMALRACVLTLALMRLRDISVEKGQVHVQVHEIAYLAAACAAVAKGNGTHKILVRPH